MEGWHAIVGAQDPGYPSAADKRKELLFSRRPWEHVDAAGDATMPVGRFLCARTATPAGPIWFLAICIPWAHAHVANGRRDRAVWEEHLRYLDRLDSFLGRRTCDGPVVLLGDFNQRIPRKRCPEHVHDKLMAVLGERFSVITTGVIASAEEQAIDHVALGPGLAGSVIATLPKCTPEGKKLSDHFGLVLELEASASPMRTAFPRRVTCANSPA